MSDSGDTLRDPCACGETFGEHDCLSVLRNREKIEKVMNQWSGVMERLADGACSASSPEQEARAWLDAHAPKYLRQRSVINFTDDEVICLLAAYAAHIRAEERERCAKIAESCFGSCRAAGARAMFSMSTPQL